MDSREGYPGAVKELFLNPIKKIKLSPFLEAGFSEKTLDTVIRRFTDRSKKKISIRMLQGFIKSFCKTNEEFYMEFLSSNFKNKEEGFIDIDDFMEIFLTDIEDDIQLINNREATKLFNRFSGGEQVVSAFNLVKVSESLGMKMDLKEAKEIERHCARSKEAIDKYDFLKIIKSNSD